MLYEMLYGQTPWCQAMQERGAQRTMFLIGMEPSWSISFPDIFGSPRVAVEENGAAGPPRPKNTGADIEERSSELSQRQFAHLVRVCQGVLTREVAKRWPLSHVLEECSFLTELSEVETKPWLLERLRPVQKLDGGDVPPGVRVGGAEPIGGRERHSDRHGGNASNVSSRRNRARSTGGMILDDTSIS